MIFRIISLLFIFALSPGFVLATDQNTQHSGPEEPSAKIYRSPEERRDAGLGTQITDWLKLSGLIELEKNYSENNFANNIQNIENNEPQVALQLASEIILSDWLIAELIYDIEYDLETNISREKRQSGWDEALIEATFGDIGIKLGRLYVPFGEYYSHFVTGPILEFGETRGDGIVVDYSFLDSLEFSAYLFDSKVNKQGNSSGQDWGASLEFKTENEAIVFGLGFLSDLAESDESFLADENNAFESRVSAWNAFALYGMDKFEITAEYVQANDRFREFDNNADKPSAYNIELSYLPAPTLQFALRYEQSYELSDQPEQQYGMTSTWRPGKHITVAFDYLHGQYRDGFVLDDDDNPQNNRDLLAAQISLEF